MKKWLLSNMTANLALALTMAAPAHAGPLKLSKNKTALNGQDELVLAMENGLTLYVFDPDLQAPSGSACRGVCAEKWPPVLLTTEEELSLAPRLGFIERGGGLKQLTVEGRPVYLYWADRLAGDAKGEGLGDVWHAVRATDSDNHP